MSKGGSGAARIGKVDGSVGGFSFRMSDGKTWEVNRNAQGVVFRNGQYDKTLTQTPGAFEKLQDFAKKSTTYRKLSNSYFEEKTKQRNEERSNKPDYELGIGTPWRTRGKSKTVYRPRRTK